MIASARRDPSAFAPLYEQHFQSVYAYCFRRLRTREAAEDATTQVFCQALAALNKYEHASFRAWLFAIAHNVVTDLARRQSTVARLEPAHDPIDTAATPEESALERESQARVADLLALLPEDQRQVVEFRLAGLTGTEIAAAMGRSRGAIKMLQFRAVRHLRELALDSPQADIPEAKHV